MREEGLARCTRVLQALRFTRKRGAMEGLGERIVNCCSKLFLFPRM